MDLSMIDLKELLATNGPAKAANEPGSVPYEIGENYLVRTVTMIYTGKLLTVYPQELVLVDVHWIADTELWHVAIRDVCFKEQEEYPPGRNVIIGRGAILDAVVIDKLPIGNK